VDVRSGGHSVQQIIPVAKIILPAQGDGICGINQYKVFIVPKSRESFIF
jgi:hypothetical protein